MPCSMANGAIKNGLYYNLTYRMDVYIKCYIYFILLSSIWYSFNHDIHNCKGIAVNILLFNTNENLKLLKRHIRKKE